jgi:hypothetical protein
MQTEGLYFLPRYNKKAVFCFFVIANYDLMRIEIMDHVDHVKQ